MRRCWRVGCVLFVISTVFALGSSSYAQTEAAKDKGAKAGISAAVQGEQTDLLIPIRLSNRVVIVPAIYLSGGEDVFTDFGLGIALRCGQRTGKTMPYFGARFGVLIYDPSGAGDSQTDFLFGPLVGGEYFLDDHFSLGVEAQLNIAKSGKHSLRFNNPDGMSVNTATAVMATYYF